MRCIEFILFSVILLGCESKSVWDERFKESMNLSQPTLSVSLADPDVFTFAMVGDLHIGGSDATRFRAILQTAQSEGDSFVVLLGDIADKGEAESFIAAQNALKDFGFENKAKKVIEGEKAKLENLKLKIPKENKPKIFSVISISHLLC
jgi:hypothetical protein